MLQKNKKEFESKNFIPRLFIYCIVHVHDFKVSIKTDTKSV